MQLANIGSRRTDRDLKARIVNFLFRQNVPGLRMLDVSAKTGVVTVRGLVRSFYHKQLCLSCCQRVAGVVQIRDEIDVLRQG
jgi:osmotically-inducible protein OsmY